MLVENTLPIVLIIYPLGPTEAIYTNLRANFEEDSSDVRRTVPMGGWIITTITNNILVSKIATARTVWNAVWRKHYILDTFTRQKALCFLSFVRYH